MGIYASEYTGAEHDVAVGRILGNKYQDSEDPGCHLIGTDSSNPQNLFEVILPGKYTIFFYEDIATGNVPITMPFAGNSPIFMQVTYDGENHHYQRITIGAGLYYRDLMSGNYDWIFVDMGVQQIDVIDNLTSRRTEAALSANMGRILDTKVSISEAPPETSNVAKLWVDTSPILTGGNPDLLYNGSESEDWNSLLTPLKNKIFEAYFSSSTYTGSAILGYGDTVIDTTGGRVTADSNGLIKINYDGNVRIKAQFWVKADSNERPWTRLEDYDNNRVTLISSIDDMPSGYLTVTIEKIVQNLGIHNYDIFVGLNTGGMTINGDSDSNVNSILIVELL